MRRATVFLLLAMTFEACTNPKQKKTVPAEPNAQVQTEEFRTKSGKVFQVLVDKSISASLNNVIVITREFENANDTFKLGAIDPVETIFLSDLDGNGFEELYLVSRSAGSGSYANLYGFASNRDKSVSPIYIPPISEKQLEKGERFEGFMGHNTFKIENGKLVNEFPVYLKSDTNANPTGGKREVIYGLIAGEAGWRLVSSQN
ncbi:hypothetical protein OU798_21805 [Prolixibacteraceae bacterium Z1-6]|uniref:Uncharacterized protein n=1 Tax=Draconibacterium aestuarii TaxID=2998507 RepID=A0A9X3J801_9BACT|nr:hypothetical protein [Prolixibacteraceae bacterium Z1-6]